MSWTFRWDCRRQSVVTRLLHGPKIWAAAEDFPWDAPYKAWVSQIMSVMTLLTWSGSLISAEPCPACPVPFLQDRPSEVPCPLVKCLMHRVTVLAAEGPEPVPLLAAACSAITSAQAVFWGCCLSPAGQAPCLLPPSTARAPAWSRESSSSSGSLNGGLLATTRSGPWALVVLPSVCTNWK